MLGKKKFQGLGILRFWLEELHSREYRTTAQFKRLHSKEKRKWKRERRKFVKEVEEGSDA